MEQKTFEAVSNLVWELQFLKEDIQNDRNTKQTNIENIEKIQDKINKILEEK